MGLDFFLNLSYENIVLFISDYLHSQNVHKDISSSFVNSIKTAFLSNNPNVLIQLEKGFVIAKEYDEVFLYNSDEEKKYSYVLNNGDVIDNKDFYIDNNCVSENRKPSKPQEKFTGSYNTYTKSSFNADR